jgi:hypothetical protein
MKLTSTNRSFGLIIKLSQSVFEEAQKWLARVIKQTPFLHSVVRPAVELVMPAKSVVSIAAFVHGDAAEFRQNNFEVSYVFGSYLPLRTNN